MAKQEYRAVIAKQGDKIRVGQGFMDDNNEVNYSKSLVANALMQNRIDNDALPV